MKFNEHRKIVLMKLHIKRFNTLSFTSNNYKKTKDIFVESRESTNTNSTHLFEC